MVGTALQRIQRDLEIWNTKDYGLQRLRTNVDVPELARQHRVIETRERHEPESVSVLLRGVLSGRGRCNGAAGGQKQGGEKGARECKGREEDG